MKGTATVGWTRGPYTVSVDGRYVGRYQDYDSTREIGNFWLIDGNVKFGLGQIFARDNRWLKGMDLAIGAVNLFNRLPQYSNYSGSFFGYDPAQADIRGRFLYAQLQGKF